MNHFSSLCPLFRKLTSVALFILCLVFNTFIASGQSVYQSSSNCAGHNAFAKNGGIDDIKPLVARTLENGTLYLNPDKLDSLEFVFERMDLDNGTSFEFINEYKSRLDTARYYRKYQQFYNGVEVEGGGYTFAYIRPGGPGPCDDLSEPYLLVPYIKTGISFNTTPSVSSSYLSTILSTNQIASYKLVISHNLNNQCEYKIAWRVSYYKDYPKISWIDAHTGSIIKTIDSRENLLAQTVSYGKPNLIDRNVSGTTTLESPDQRLMLFNFGNNCPDGPLNISDWSTNLIPSTTTTGDEWGNEATPEAYQLFHVATLILPVYDDLDIKFKTLHVASCTEFGAAAIRESTLLSAFCYFGEINDVTTAQFDAVGHELAHTFLHLFIDSDQLGNSSLHEAIADMLGVFTEFKATGTLDWVMGDDESVIEEAVDRDLEHPGTNYDCFTEVMNEGKYKRGNPLRYWFFTISQGGPNISGLGIDRSLDIVIDALKMVQMDADYPELMEATLTVVIDQYGACSNEFITVARAWELICLDTGFPTANGLVSGCNYVITGPDQPCEENDGAEFCIEGGLENFNYRFTIIGKKSTEFTSQCGMQGNSQEVNGCDCLTLIDFPDYPYYPQVLYIEVYSPTIGSKYIQRKKVIIRDCDEDDPTCKDFYNLINYNGIVSNNSESMGQVKVKANIINGETNTGFDPFQDKSDCEIKVFDIMGRLLYVGKKSAFTEQDIQYQGLVIIIDNSSSRKPKVVRKLFLLN